MALTDPCCTLVPYFKVHDGKLDEFRKYVEQFVEKTQSEAKCLHYGFSFNGQYAHCREGYADAEAMLAHLENVGAVLDQALKVADLIRLEVHAPAAELDKLREPLKGLNPDFYTMEIGFRR
jgi:quinol monooxygenase YgiN